jgi:hypothetical protein
VSKRRSYRITDKTRAAIEQAVREASNGAFVDITTEERRTEEQNERMWSMLDDIAEQLPWRDWQGRVIRMDSEEWKNFFLALLWREQKMVMNPEGTGMVLVDRRSGSSTLRISEMSDLMALIEAFAAERNVRLKVWS